MNTFRINPDLDREFFARRAKIQEIETLDELSERERTELTERQKSPNASTKTLTKAASELLEFLRMMLERRAVNEQPLTRLELVTAIDPTDTERLIWAFKTGDFSAFETKESALPNTKN